MEATVLVVAIVEATALGVVIAAVVTALAVVIAVAAIVSAHVIGPVAAKPRVAIAVRERAPAQSRRGRLIARVPLAEQGAAAGATTQ